MPDESVSLTVTSPPYDALRDYKGYSFNFEGIAAELLRITKKGGVVVWIVKDATVDGSETGTSFKQALHFKDIGFRLHDTMIYQRNGVTFPDAIRYYNCFEYMFVLSRGKPKTFNPIKDHRNSSAGQMEKGGERTKEGTLRERWATRVGRVRPEWSSRWNVWTYCTGSMHTAKDAIWKDHPAVFPLALAKDHIRSWSNPGELVFDPMAGSGQTLIAAKMLQRDYLGMDCSPEYVDLARRRLELY